MVLELVKFSGIEVWLSLVELSIFGEDLCAIIYVFGNKFIFRFNCGFRRWKVLIL